MTPTLDPPPGFWVRLLEPDARSIAAGDLPATVRQDVTTMLRDYDAHMAGCLGQLEAVAHGTTGITVRVKPRRRGA